MQKRINNTASVAPKKRRVKKTISAREKFLLGGLGGLTPLFALLVAAEATVIGSYIVNIQNSDVNGAALLLGYLVKCIVLVLIGAFWVHLHHSETDKMKLYQLGIVAPAVLTTVLGASANTNSANIVGAALNIFVNSAFADSRESENPHTNVLLKV